MTNLINPNSKAHSLMVMGISAARSYGSFACLLWLLVWALLSYPLSLHADEQHVDGITAIVNNGVVLDSELDQRLQTVLYNIRSPQQSPPSLNRLKHDLLSQLIIESIQLQMATRVGIRVNDEQLQQAMQRIAEQNGMTVAAFKEALEAQGITYTTTREQVRREMSVHYLQQSMINPRIHITEQEINNFLLSQAGQALTEPEYHVLHALLAVPGGTSREQADRIAAAAEQLYQTTLMDGSLQTTIEHRVADDSLPEIPTPPQFTDLGWRTVNDLPSLLADSVPTLTVDETLPPLRSPSGFRLIQLIGKRGDGDTIQQTKVRHILLKVSIIRDQDATATEINTLREHVIEDDDFLALARQYSEDLGSALEGGDLGWVSPSQLVSSFEETMDNTAIGQISPAFQTPFGWHILQVDDRREKDVSDKLRRRLATSILHERQYQDELAAWLQQIRDEAYVDIKS